MLRTRSHGLRHSLLIQKQFALVLLPISALCALIACSMPLVFHHVRLKRIPAYRNKIAKFPIHSNQGREESVTAHPLWSKGKYMYMCPHPGCGPGESIALCLKIQTTLLIARCQVGVKIERGPLVSSSYMLFLLILMLSCSNTICDSKREQPDVT